MLRCKFDPSGTPGTPVPITKEGIINLFRSKGYVDVDVADHWMMIRFADGSALQVSQLDDDDASKRPQGDVYVTYYVELEREDETP
jgi:hypothetical protein